MKDYNGPHFYIQMGHQEQNRTRTALQDGISAGVIGSPKDLTAQQLGNYLASYKKLNAQIYIDPQFYNPFYRTSKTGYPFSYLTTTWDKLENKKIQTKIINQFLTYQQKQEVDSFILPIPYIVKPSSKTQVKNKILTIINGIINTTQIWMIENQVTGEVLMPLLLSTSFIRSQVERNKLLAQLFNLDLDGFLLIFMNDKQQSINNWHPRGEDTIVGMLDIIFRLKQQNFKVLNSYSSLVSFLAFPFGLDGFASGGYSNRRSFNLKDWIKTNKSKWHKPNPRYWTLELLGCLMFPRKTEQSRASEVDLIYQARLWEKLRTPTYYDGQLFREELPSLLQQQFNWQITKSFLHYFHICHKLAGKFIELNLKQRINLVRALLDEAAQNYSLLENNNIKLKPTRDGSHIQDWQLGFEKYLSSVKDELTDEFY